MKTKEEVVRHLADVGYSKAAIVKISGYLIGQNIKEKDEYLKFKIGENTFDDFYRWYTTEPDALYEVFAPIIEALAKEEHAKRYECPYIHITIVNR